MGLELARAYVTVRGDTSRVTSDITQSKGRILGAVRGIAAGAARIMGTIGAPVGGALAFASLIKGGEDFNRKMRNSLAIMGEVSGALQDDMKKAALDAASSTQFSASQAAESFFFLASAGLDASQSIAALPQVAQFAQAGMFDMATATDLATDAQSALGLTVKDPTENLANLTRVTDVLVKANTLANASVQQFSTALTTKAAASARNAGKDIEETVAVLAAFADQGIKGQIAGTAFSIVMRDLQTKARENKSAFEQAGVAVYDQSGAMRNLGDIVGDLEGALGGMNVEQQSAAIAQLGFADKSKIFLQTLIGTSDKIKEYEANVRKAGGTTSDVASKQLTPTQKGIAKLGAAWTKLGDVINQGTGDAIGGALSFVADMVDQVTKFVEEMQFIFRNFSAIVQVAFIDIGLTALKVFPQMEKSSGETAAFLSGVWAGLGAFFSNIIGNMIGGLKELKNFAVAVGAAISAAFSEISQGNFKGAIKAATDTFLETLASQKDVKAPNAFVAFQQAFDETQKKTLDSFAKEGGFANFLEAERQRLLDSVGKSEQAILDAKKGSAQATKAAVAGAPGEEGGGPLAPAFESQRIGFADLGKTIQDIFLKDNTEKEILEQNKMQTNKLGMLVEQGKRPNEAGFLTE